MKRSCWHLLTLALLLTPGMVAVSPAQHGSAWRASIPEPMVTALDSITAQSLRSHVSFLASDALEGRPTPSGGQDAAAEYIAAQFRKAGLEPVTPGDYFQVSTMEESRPDCVSFDAEFSVQGKPLRISRASFTLSAVTNLDIEKAPVFKRSFGRVSAQGLPNLSGKVLVVAAPHSSSGETDEETSVSEWHDFLRHARDLSPALIVRIEQQGAGGVSYFDTARLHLGGNRPRAPLIATIRDPSVARILNGLHDGETGAAFSLHVRETAPVERRLRNIAAILKGSDPVLRESYVFLTAHYDGTGPGAAALQDRIWNAANDNASGVASLLDIALALGSLSQRPRRSMVFVAFFGEEDGMLGSRYYAAHPLVPIKDTAAVINLEHLGRTDAPEGDQTGRVSLTGSDYSEVGEVFRVACAQSGIVMSPKGRDSDTYFMASDNIVFAELGVPAHTLCVSYMYPDYHGAADHWDKIDFDNMSAVTRMTARALLLLALSDHVPLWDSSNPRTARFRDALGRHTGSP